MNDLIRVQESEELTSLKVAEVTGKRHANVMADIRDEMSKLQLSDNQQELIFKLSYHTQKIPNGGTKQIPIYNLTEDGWLQIGARYDAKVRYPVSKIY